MSPVVADEAHTPPNLAWLVRLRWLAVVSQAFSLLMVKYLIGLELALLPLLTIVLVTALSNAALTLWLRREPRVEEWVLASVMALDFLLLTALLYCSGGPSNPFTVLFLVHIALAAVVLKPGYAYALSLLSSACFFALFMLPARSDGVSDAMAMHAHHHHDQSSMSLHLKGMWVAFFIAATVIAYFVTRVTRDLEHQRNAAALARTRALRSERLASLATLAAGAAHELATPLGTIAVVAKELERELSSEGQQAVGSAADAKLIREEVERCKHILTQMASDAGESAGEAFSRVDVRTLLELSLEEVNERARVDMRIEQDATVQVPLRAFARALRGLIRNALQASNERVVLSATRSARGVEIVVRDRGTGMSPELLARVGEPFFTTKEPGRGMGLGVFLARALTERMGGSMEFDSLVGQGTEVRVVLPQHASSAGALHHQA